MRPMYFFVLILCIVLACKEDEDPEKHSSILGYWTVVTPDNATTVTFHIAQNADSEYVIDGVSVRHAGTEYASKPIDADVAVLSPTEIESITIVTTEPSIPFFVIRFLGVSVNNDFTRMEMQNSTFNIDGVFRQFADIAASR